MRKYKKDLCILLIISLVGIAFLLVTYGSQKKDAKVVPSPNNSSTRLKSNKPTNPQFKHPTMLKTKQILYNVLINSSFLIILLTTINYLYFFLLFLYI